jgi:hypothetical protein
VREKEGELQLQDGTPARLDALRPRHWQTADNPSASDGACCPRFSTPCRGRVQVVHLTSATCRVTALGTVTAVGTALLVLACANVLGPPRHRVNNYIKSSGTQWHVCRSLRTVPWVLASTQRPVLEALCLQPHSGRHGMSPNALSRCGSAVELLAWLPILVGHTARVVSSVTVGYHPADSKRAQRANCNEVNSDAISRIDVKEQLR